MSRKKTKRSRQLKLQSLENRKLMHAGPIFLPVAEPLSGTLDKPREVGKLHSKPDAPVTILLDFDGHFQSEWGRGGQFTDIESAPFELDDEAKAEAIIRQTWMGIAEDYAPFDVDVTTEDPGTTSEKRKVMRIVFDHSETPFYAAGGVGMNSGWFNDDLDDVSYVFTRSYINRGRDAETTATRFASVGSQESGHHFGLEHQSEFDDDGNFREYSRGENGWAPIMGNGYRNSRTTWWDGLSGETADLLPENTDFNGDGLLHESEISVPLFQDDLRVLNQALSSRVDDHGDVFSAATPMATANIAVASGIITTMEDVDVFSYHSHGGDVTFAVSVLEHSANLDARLEVWGKGEWTKGEAVISSDLEDLAGLYPSFRMLAAADPDDALDASLRMQLSEGEYFIVVRSHGRYGDLGHYVLGAVRTPDGIFVPELIEDEKDLAYGEKSSLIDSATDKLIPVFENAKPSENLLSATKIDAAFDSWSDESKRDVDDVSPLAKEIALMSKE